MFTVKEVPIAGENTGAAIDTRMMQFIRAEIQQAQKDALNILNGTNVRMQAEIMSQINEKLAGKKTQPIMCIEVNGVSAKLTSPASPVLPRMIVNAKLGLNSLLVGPAGCGKTQAAHQLSEALGLPFYHVSFTAGASETWLYGRQTPQGFVPGPLHLAALNGGVLLGDELDAADANMALCLNTLLANGVIYNPINGETIKKHPDFVFVGTANSFGKGGNGVYTGRNRLDAATLDRFVTLKVTYDATIEDQICDNAETLERFRFARSKIEELSAQEIISYRAIMSYQKQVNAGVSDSDALDSITASWPDELKKACFPAKKGKKATVKDASKAVSGPIEDAVIAVDESTGAAYEPF